MSKAYILLECTGSYSDYREHAVCVYLLKSDAQKQLEALKQREEKLAMRQVKLSRMADRDNGPKDENGYTKSELALERFEDKYGYDAGDATYRIDEVKLVKTTKGREGKKELNV